MITLPPQAICVTSWCLSSPVQPQALCWNMPDLCKSPTLAQAGPAPGGPSDSASESSAGTPWVKLPKHHFSSSSMLLAALVLVSPPVQLSAPWVHSEPLAHRPPCWLHSPVQRCVPRQAAAQRIVSGGRDSDDLCTPNHDHAHMSKKGYDTP